MAVFPFSQFEFRTQALLALVQANLTLAPQVSPKTFSAGGSLFQIESITILSNNSLRSTRIYPWNYEYDTYLGKTLSAPDIQARFVEALQRVRVSLSRVMVDSGQTTFEDAGEFEGNAVVVLRAWPAGVSGGFGMMVENFEQDGSPPSAPDFREGLRNAVTGALRNSSITTNLPTFMARRGDKGQLVGPLVGHAGIAAAVDGGRVAIRLQIGRSVNTAQYNDWVRFHAGDFPDTMAVPAAAPNDWAVVLSAPMIEGIVTRSIDDAMREHHDQIRLQGGVSVDWAPENGEPRVNASWHAELIDACIGLGNIDYDMSAVVRFSVPAPNILQTQNDVSWDANDLQVFSCSLAAGAVAFLGGGILGFRIGGLIGAGIGAWIGGIGGFIGSIMFASTFVPDMAPPDCTQSGKRITCDIPLSTQVPLGVNADGTPRSLQLTPNRVGGHADGLFLAGRLPGIPIPMNTRAFISGRNFAWAAPSTDCGVSAMLKLVMAEHMRELAAPVARVTITHDAAPGQAKLELYSVKRVSADPYNVFPDSGIRVRPIAHWIDVSIVATPNFFYYADRYSLSVRVATNGGTRIVDLGRIPMLTDEIVEELKGGMMGTISDCYSMIDEFTRKFGKMNPKWIPDPPPYALVAKTRRLWLLEVQGLQPGELLSVVADNRTFGVQANRQGVAQIRALTGHGEFSLQRTSVNDHTTANGDLPEGTPHLRYVSRQVELAEQATFSLPSAAEALDVGRTEGAPLLSVLLNGEVLVYNLQQPASPRLVYRSHVGQANGVLNGADGVYVAAANGLTRWSPSDRTQTRLSDQPVFALSREGSSITASLDDGRRLSVRPGEFPALLSQAETSLQAGTSLRSTSDEQRKRWAAPLAGPNRYIALDREGRYALYDRNAEENEALETYAELPWFANAITLGPLVVVQSAERQSHALTIYFVGSTASSFPAKAAEIAAQIHKTDPDRLKVKDPVL